MTDNQPRGRLRPLLSGVLLRTQTDGRLAALASTGHQHAFSAIYERYRRELGAHAGRIVRADRADDIVQHAMLAAWSALLSGAEISDLRAWLHRVTHNAALDTITRRGYDDGEISESSVASSLTEDLADGRLSAAAALTALAALPEGQRRALTLTAIEGRSGHDAALEMGISDSAMRQLVYRARSSVRSAVTAVIPLPLINWLIATSGAPATPAAVSLGVASGGAATIAKIVAVIGVSAATIGATLPFQTHHPSRHTRNVPLSRPARATANRASSPLALPASQLPIDPPSASGRNHATGRLAAERNRAPGQPGQSQQSSGNRGPQLGSGSLAGVGANRQSGTRQQSGANQHNATLASAGNQPSGTQQQSGATQDNATVASAGNQRSGTRQQSGATQTNVTASSSANS